MGARNRELFNGQSFSSAGCEGSRDLSHDNANIGNTLNYTLKKG